MLKILCVCGARPNFMKIAPIVRELSSRSGVVPVLVHTGQHYDARMSDLFFSDLGLPPPDINLEVGSLSHAVQTAEIMKRFEPVCLGERPDWAVVVGDVNSTVACALVAVKLGIGVAHVEAGLRSFDRTMPEEINRVVTDAISDRLFVTERSGVENLRREGVCESKVHFVGNVMIDTLLAMRERADRSSILRSLELSPKKFALVTLHRPSNVDNEEQFAGIVAGLERIAEDVAVVFPVHPRTRARMEEMGLADRLEKRGNVRLIEPLGYLDFMKLMSEAKAVLTDSGGIQEETTILGVPCLTLRRNTERPVTIEQGTNRLVEPGEEAMVAAYREVCGGGSGEAPTGCSGGVVPELWDGRAAGRIVDVLTGVSS